MLEQMAPFLAVVADAENLLDQPPQQVLPRLVDGFLRTVQQPVIGRFVRILLSEAARHPSVAEFFAKTRGRWSSCISSNATSPARSSLAACARTIHAPPRGLSWACWWSTSWVAKSFP